MHLSNKIGVDERLESETMVQKEESGALRLCFHFDKSNFVDESEDVGD